MTRHSDRNRTDVVYNVRTLFKESIIDYQFDPSDRAELRLTTRGMSVNVCEIERALWKENTTQ